MNLFLFVAKMFLCSGILFTYYWFFLRNKRFHHYNRFYLLAIVLISLVFPFLEISIPEKSQTISPAMHQAIDMLSVNSWEANWNEEDNQVVNEAEPLFTTSTITLFAYSLILLCLLVLLLKSIIYIIRIRSRYQSEPIGDLKLYNTLEPGTPFSFFKSIFWNQNISFNSKEGQQIFRHELFHVRQHHSSDSLFMELVCIICWFNPFFYLIRKELRAIHEFLADQYAISGNDRYAYAELLVLQSIRQKKVSFVHPFFQNNIKRRIAMITKFQKTRYGYWSRVMALPILIVLFCVIALKAQQISSAKPVVDAVDKAIQTITVLVDAGHGGKDPGAYSPDQKHVEKDLALAISKKIKEKAAAYNVNVIMTREDDNAPELKARTDQAIQTKADLLVSIHIASEPPAVVKGNTGDKVFPRGIMIYPPKAGTPNAKQSQLLSNSLLKSMTSVYSTYGIMKKDRSSIWIIDKAPCAAVLLECGNIAHKADLDFILNESNQEKIADAILKGIVEYKKSDDTKQAYNTQEEEFNVVATEVIAERKEAAGPDDEVKVEPVETIYETPEQTRADLSKKVYVNIQDDIKRYIAQHLMKTVRYPEEARKNNRTSSIYFAVDVDEKGKIQMVDIIKYNVYGEGGKSKNPNAQDIVIVGKLEDKSKPVVVVPSVAHDMWEKELDKSIKSYSPPANTTLLKSEKLYFRLVFTLKDGNEVADASIQTAIVSETNIAGQVNVASKTNVQAKINNVVEAAGTTAPSVNIQGQVNDVVAVNEQVAIKGQAATSINAVNIAGVEEVPKKTNFRKDPFPVDLIRKFKTGETKMSLIKDELGEPSNQFMDSYTESWAYYGINERLMLTFNREDGRLINYSYFKDERKKSVLNYEDVKEIKQGVTSFKDLLKKFGKPSEIHIDNNTESWAYFSDSPTMSRLMVMTTDKATGVVNQMSFDSQKPSSAIKSPK